MTGGILGAFASLDLFFFYFFHELALGPYVHHDWLCGAEATAGPTPPGKLQSTLVSALHHFGWINRPINLQSALTPSIFLFWISHLRDHQLPLTSQNFIFPLLLFGFGFSFRFGPSTHGRLWDMPLRRARPRCLHAGVLKKFGLYALIRVALPMLPQAAQKFPENS